MKAPGDYRLPFVATSFSAIFKRSSIHLRGSARRRCGFSVVELMVSLGVIGLLLSLLLPAVQSSWEASRRLQCISNLKQLGLATENFVDHQRAYPYGDDVLVKLLPLLEQNGPANESNADLQVPVYVCPSDISQPAGRSIAHYYMNNGAKIGLNSARTAWERNGIYSIKEWELDGRPRLSPRDVRDGLSTTSLFSERRYGPFPDHVTDAACGSDPIRCIWHIRHRRFYAGEEDAFAAHASRSSNRTTVSSGADFDSEAMGAYLNTLFGYSGGYDHILPPNTVGCYPKATQIDQSADMAITATSRHPGGVNVVLCDGSARFIAAGIDLKVWRAYGSRNASDIVGGF